MKCGFLLFLFFASLQLAQATPLSQRRVSDLKVGSTLLLQLADPVLLEKREHKWQEGTQENGLRCSLKIQSHFDRALAEKSGLVAYTVTQSNPGDSVGIRGEVRDQFTFWLTTENKDLPFLSLDCFRIYLRDKVASSPLTFERVTALLQQPNLFHKPLLNPSPSRLAADFAPAFSPTSRIRMLQPLSFAAMKGDHGTSLKEPLLHLGRVVNGLPPGGSASCRVSFRRFDLDEKSYELTLPAGTVFTWTYLTGLTKPQDERDMQLFHIGMREVGGAAELTIGCASLDRYFHDFAEVQSHLDSIFELQL